MCIRDRFLIFNKGKRPRSCSKNKENFGLKSNSVSVYGPSSRRIGRLLGNLSSEQEHKVRLKCIRGWRQVAAELRLEKMHKEQFKEDWLVAIHFNEQMLYSKGVLGFMQHKESADRMIKVMEELEVSKAILCLSKCLHLWQGIVCKLNH
eukprot:TRINITY_DN18757_c0_g2_i3.p3 TRINITY_DN18757_c0_g2~~TRINITY_DN18757_c0_g2_i3.p3  ORF type:complete len:149 (-),score=39.90 TRINITY_DN18757_c0_g2_i3:385-831(-)